MAVGFKEVFELVTRIIKHKYDSDVPEEAPTGIEWPVAPGKTMKVIDDTDVLKPNMKGQKFKVPSLQTFNIFYELTMKYLANNDNQSFFYELIWRSICIEDIGAAIDGPPATSFAGKLDLRLNSVPEPTFNKIREYFKDSLPRGQTKVPLFYNAFPGYFECNGITDFKERFEIWLTVNSCENFSNYQDPSFTPTTNGNFRDPWYAGTLFFLYNFIKEGDSYLPASPSVPAPGTDFSTSEEAIKHLQNALSYFKTVVESTTVAGSSSSGGTAIANRIEELDKLRLLVREKQSEIETIQKQKTKIEEQLSLTEIAKNAAASKASDAEIAKNEAEAKALAAETAKEAERVEKEQAQNDLTAAQTAKNEAEDKASAAEAAEEAERVEKEKAQNDLIAAQTAEKAAKDAFTALNAEHDDLKIEHKTNLSKLQSAEKEKTRLEEELNKRLEAIVELKNITKGGKDFSALTKGNADHAKFVEKYNVLFNGKDTFSDLEKRINGSAVAVSISTTSTKIELFQWANIVKLGYLEGGIQMLYDTQTLLQITSVNMLFNTSLNDVLENVRNDLKGFIFNDEPKLQGLYAATLTDEDILKNRNFLMQIRGQIMLVCLAILIRANASTGGIFQDRSETAKKNKKYAEDMMRCFLYNAALVLQLRDPYEWDFKNVLETSTGTSTITGLNGDHKKEIKGFFETLGSTFARQPSLEDFQTTIIEISSILFDQALWILIARCDELVLDKSATLDSEFQPLVNALTKSSTKSLALSSTGVSTTGSLPTRLDMEPGTKLCDDFDSFMRSLSDGNENVFGINWKLILERYKAKKDLVESGSPTPPDVTSLQAQVDALAPEIKDRDLFLLESAVNKFKEIKTKLDSGKITTKQELEDSQKAINEIAEIYQRAKAVDTSKIKEIESLPRTYSGDVFNDLDAIAKDFFAEWRNYLSTGSGQPDPQDFLVRMDPIIAAASATTTTTPPAGGAGKGAASGDGSTGDADGGSKFIELTDAEVQRIAQEIVNEDQTLSYDALYDLLEDTYNVNPDDTSPFLEKLETINGDLYKEFVALVELS